MPSYSALMLASRITFPHFSVSSTSSEWLLVVFFDKLAARISAAYTAKPPGSETDGFASLPQTYTSGPRVGGDRRDGGVGNKMRGFGSLKLLEWMIG
ncbi:MAG TPA: hypothetical protein VGU64_13130 [Terriglobales bacterium]|nr:hypothetical protein [Terriglobales bacterium]